jgi:hypothetical protein
LDMSSWNYKGKKLVGIADAFALTPFFS